MTNAEIRQRLHISTTKVDTAKRRKLQLFGHICRTDDGRLAKTVMLSTEIDPQGDHIVVRLTTEVSGVLPSYTKQQHWLSTEMLGE